jgi:hypothetical protein
MVFIVVFSFALLSSVVLTTGASANQMNGKGNCTGRVCTDRGVPCPAGTCSRIGTPYARDAKYCSAKCLSGKNLNPMNHL